jgi:hypothetical protein
MKDDNADGIIELPLVPVGSRLALGVGQSDGDVDCDIYSLIGSGVVGQQIVVPQLTNAVAGGSLGTNFGESMAPPSLFTPGDRFTVTDGVLLAWSSLRSMDERATTILHPAALSAHKKRRREGRLDGFSVFPRRDCLSR